MKRGGIALAIACKIVATGCATGVVSHQADGTEMDLSKKNEAFAILPYVQDVRTSSACILYRSARGSGSRVVLETADAPAVQVAGSGPDGRACVDGLRAGTQYKYRVHLDTGEASPAYAFDTARTRYDSVRFALLADTQTLHDFHDNFVAPLNEGRFDLIITAEDLIGPENLVGPSDRDGSGNANFVPYASISQRYGNRVPVYPVVGNHDYDHDTLGGDLALSAFWRVVTTPGNDTTARDGEWYSVRRGFVKFVFLNSNLAKLRRHDPAKLDAQLNWLDAELAPGRDAREGLPDPEVVVVTYHHPGYSSGIHTTSSFEEKDPSARLVRELFVPRLKGRATLVLNGHEHLYERSVVDGIMHVSAGPAGGVWGVAVKANPKGCAGTVRNVARTLTECEARPSAGLVPARIDCRSLQVVNKVAGFLTGGRVHPIDDFAAVQGVPSQCEP